ncbi:hypothetical protein [Burkholderia cenocepacia]|uniref:hypothetical protein n=1 Tax=Burkholderia cenocepacia TaxID=95486 RepID=UPI00097C8A3E|nr:hypothetical protein [Burkholderia cenocepacia]ONJ18758.1 hypothetical protein A8D82_07045 [Burkholderia cenocepacia]
MWDSAFLISTQRVTDALLRKPVLSTGGKAFEKISAAIAVRMALRARPSIEQSLLFIVPEATASTADMTPAVNRDWCSGFPRVIVQIS